MALQKYLLGLAVAALSLSHPALAQDTNAAEDEITFGYHDENVIIVGAVRAPGETLKINTEAEKSLSDIPRTLETDNDKDAALLEFALNGLTELEDETEQTISEEE